jgi:hypothetical protein
VGRHEIHPLRLDIDDAEEKERGVAGSGQDQSCQDSPAQAKSQEPAKDSMVIPRWFKMLEAHNALHAELRARGEVARYKELVRKICATPEPSAPQKEWHEPNERWPYPSWKKHGEASRAERDCKLCKTKRSGAGDYRKAHDRLQAKVDRAIARVTEQEKRDFEKEMKAVRDEAEKACNKIHIDLYGSVLRDEAVVRC